MLRINVVTLFPEVFEAALAVSIPGRAAEQQLVRYRVVQLRSYTHDRHKTVDDYPYGGGAGMVLKPEPFFEAVEDLRVGPPIVLLSARGRRFTHRDAVRFAVGTELTLLCGHYKDVDQRVADGLERKSCRWAISCFRVASRRRCACSTRWYGCSRARWATTSPQRRTRITTGCCRRRATRARRAIAEWMCPRYC